MSFVKLSSSITRSTIWDETPETCKLWITMLSLSDPTGYVGASLPGLAREARLSVEDTDQGLQRLMAPDPYSRSPEFEGRRVEKVTGGWFILNFRKTWESQTREEKREADRERQRRHRESAVSRPVTPGHEKSLGEREESGASPASPSGEPSVRIKDPASLPHSSEQNVCKTTTARDPSSTAPATARAPRKRRPTLTEEAQRERAMIRELFAAYTRAMVRVHGPLAAIAPAESEPHLKAAREVLESCGWDVAAACALVDLYPEMREDKWVVDRKWAFRWVASRISDLAAERAKRTEDPAVANERWRQQEIAEMKRMGIDVSDD